MLHSTYNDSTLTSILAITVRLSVGMEKSKFFFFFSIFYSTSSSSSSFSTTFFILFL